MNHQLKICVLLPDYSTSDVDYQQYDPPRNLSHLFPEAEIDHVFLNKLTTYKQLKDLSVKDYDIFVNLCEGYLEWTVPSIDVIYFLEQLNLPFTGPNSILYDPPKDLMKYVAYTQGVDTPDFFVAENCNSISEDEQRLHYPLFVKPLKAGDSLGIDEHSRVENKNQLLEKMDSLLDQYSPLLIEQYVEGREFTVMVIRSSGQPDGVLALTPVEYIFPENRSFKTYALKTSELHHDANIAVVDETLSRRLKRAAIDIFNGFGGVGYARLDFRMDADGRLFFLEINFTCSVFYADGYEGSADHILRVDGLGQTGFLRMIIEEGLERYEKKKMKYRVKGSSVSGYGIYATVDLVAGDIVFRGEERAQRIVTKSFVEKNWSDKEKITFAKYAYPISEEVFLLWDTEPVGWAPQNHSCDANTRYDGLNVVASRDIKAGEELTLNYSSFLDEHMEAFNCNCGSANCIGYTKGIPGNTITQREFLKRKNN